MRRLTCCSRLPDQSGDSFWLPKSDSCCILQSHPASTSVATSRAARCVQTALGLVCTGTHRCAEPSISGVRAIAFLAWAVTRGSLTIAEPALTRSVCCMHSARARANTEFVCARICSSLGKFPSYSLLPLRWRAAHIVIVAFMIRV